MNDGLKQQDGGENAIGASSHAVIEPINRDHLSKERRQSQGASYLQE